MTNGTTLEGRVVVITGATQGIGRGTADALALEGASLAICGRTPGAAEQTARELRATYSIEAFGAALDVSRSDDVREFAARCEQTLGPAAAVINNAAVLGPVGPLHLVDQGEWSLTMSINVGGVANVVAAFWDQLALVAGGRIINLSGGGLGGPTPMQRTASYVASKAAVVALTEALAEEAAEIGATANAVAPGAIATGFMSGVLAAGEDLAGAVLYRDASKRTDGPHPESLKPFVSLVRFLLSAESSQINGRTLSARWETPDRLRTAISDGLDESRFRLRRIDGDLYGPLP